MGSIDDKEDEATGSRRRPWRFMACGKKEDTWPRFSLAGAVAVSCVWCGP